MKKWKNILIGETTTLIETMRIIDENAMQLALVVDPDEKLLGTVTDGDIRRALLKGRSLDVFINEVMNTNPVVGSTSQSRSHYIQILKSQKLKHLPIVSDGKVIDLIFADEHQQGIRDNSIFLMVGGLGTRLRPLTNEIPKPMLHVGGKPLLEIIIEGFKQYGYSNFILSVNYKKEVIKDYFNNGDALGVSIEYIEETKRMGTAGALSLLYSRPKSPIIVMNGDLLTQINYDQLLQFHEAQGAAATMCVREYEYQIPYGVIETHETNLISIKEKPTHKCFVNAGIYVLSPEVFDYIPNGQFFDMPELFEKLIANNKPTSVFPIREYWLDIGRIEDFEKANDDYKERYQ